MIAIVNTGPHDDPNPLGERTYEVRINRDIITTFRHKRGDGLGMCLLAASKAVEKQKWEDDLMRAMGAHLFKNENDSTYEN